MSQPSGLARSIFELKERVQLDPIQPGSIVYPGVVLPPDIELGPFVVLGMPLRGRAAGETATYIGPGAVIRSHSVIYAGNQIGARFQTGHGTLIREENEIGDDVSIGSHSIVEHHVVIHDGVRIHSNAFVPEYTLLEAGCWLGPNVVLTNARYPQSPGVKAALRGPHIGAGARLGANVTVLPGVNVGAGALVGAGSVVVRDVAPGMVVAGNPARVLRAVAEVPEYQAAPGLEAGRGS